jgi:CubicO group peptidase (beta-lactamase class C family)
VLAGFDGDTPKLRTPARQATVRNLVTHTSGLGYWFWSEPLARWEKVTGIPNVAAARGRRRRCEGRAGPPVH